jgi:hypothetical protein
MQSNSNIKKWLIRGIGVAFISTSSYLAYKYILQNRLKSKIKRVSESNQIFLTKESLHLILETARIEIHPKIRKINQKLREKRKKMDPYDERYSEIVKQDNQRITNCIENILQNVRQKLQVTKNEFEISVEFYQDRVIQNKLIDLRTIRDPNPPKLAKKDIIRVLNYFIKVLKEIEEVSLIEIFELETSLIKCEDTVYFMFKIEKADFISQAHQMAQSDPEVREKLEIYRVQIRKKEGLFQGNNFSNLQIS